MAVTVTINGVDRTSVVNWRTAKIIEAGITQKVGRAEFEVIDKTLSLSFANGQPVVWADGAEELFQGKLVSVKRRSMHSPAGARKVTHALRADDHNAVLDERVVGAPTGFLWTGPNLAGEYVADDPSAHTGSTDKDTVESLFAAYVASPVMDATTYVEEFIPAGVLGSHIIYWDRVYLRKALDDLAAFAGINVVHWIRGTDVIWTRMPDPSDPDDPLNAPPLMFPAAPGTPDEAPYAITDDSPDGVTTVGSEASEYEEDQAGQAGAANPYIRGATDVVLVDVGIPVFGGSGWYPNNSRDPGQRQIMVDAPNSDSVARRDAIGARVVARATRSRRKGFSVVTGYNGWHACQVVTITDAALGLAGARYLIQRVSFGFVNPTTRRYRIEWGDAPTTRLTDGPPLGSLVPPVPAPVHAIYVPPLSPIPGTTKVITGQLVNGAGTAWRIEGKTVEWTLVLTDIAGDPATDAGAGVAPGTSVTNADGEAMTEITYGTITGIVYDLQARVVVE